ncbi:hypothetical protein B0T20DRAFT_189468 [Sordaria brevicollis]|uniref:Uncharacterized protein n=1 Tax=Sordaria brevicollis TaxID=83679 RepID=A0AAE0PFL1_SORBR|nr:hypothetical protein B0T20DRAFT_189468 [Sordaria brevicollis]
MPSPVYPVRLPPLMQICWEASVLPVFFVFREKVCSEQWTARRPDRSLFGRIEEAEEEAMEGQRLFYNNTIRIILFRLYGLLERYSLFVLRANNNMAGMAGRIGLCAWPDPSFERRIQAPKYGVGRTNVNHLGALAAESKSGTGTGGICSRFSIFLLLRLIDLHTTEPTRSVTCLLADNVPKSSHEHQHLPTQSTLAWHLTLVFV